jgi:hypothetical protein
MVPGQARILIARMQFIAISLLAALAATGLRLKLKVGTTRCAPSKNLLFNSGNMLSINSKPKTNLAAQ